MSHDFAKDINDKLSASHPSWSGLAIHKREAFLLHDTVSSVINAAGKEPVAFAQAILSDADPLATVNYIVVSYTADLLLYTYRERDVMGDVTTKIYPRAALESIEIVKGPIVALTTAPHEDLVVGLQYRGGLTFALRDRSGALKDTLLDSLRADLLR